MRNGGLVGPGLNIGLVDADPDFERLLSVENLKTIVNQNQPKKNILSYLITFENCTFLSKTYRSGWDPPVLMLKHFLVVFVVTLDD